MEIPQKAYLKFTNSQKASGQPDVAEKARSRLQGKKPSGSGTSKTEKIFTVQFNPMELAVSTEKGSRKEKRNIQQKQGKISEDACVVEDIPGMNLSVHLIFDGTGKAPDYVKKMTEGLLAAAKESSCDLMTTFYWENFVFTGILESVEAQYVIFDEEGCPLRSYVDFTISLTDKVKMAELLAQDYHRLFSG